MTKTTVKTAPKTRASAISPMGVAFRLKQKEAASRLAARTGDDVVVVADALRREAMVIEAQARDLSEGLLRGPLLVSFEARVKRAKSNLIAWGLL